ncbi:electron transfer flavoprotein subunit alpha/FixB family protein [Halococcoides cellulosivorans]|uniref:Electron transfer flavoprotein subunit alpha n=1 Tax=Halococcoides cellulosivorans TaxID=1679096 RepID=A0A2R4WXH9_9EURY|nr:electron transfer flavoprotein subunit alpha/FixB family protein [Halococcoides cellulosivorans]AWB26247.1 electron transfer flavoprotein subunit alpha [Halococcoides cellulosivorans]
MAAVGEPDVDLDAHTDVWVFIEQHDGEVAAVSWELLGKGRDLADQKGEDLVALVLGEDLEESGIPDEAIDRGADRVLVADDPVFAPYRADAYGQQFRHLVEQRKPDIVLIGGTHTGRDFAGRVAVPTHAGLTADTTELEITPDQYEMRRPAFGGDALATIICPNHRPQMSTVRPGVFDEPSRGDGDGAIEQVEVVVEENDTKSEVLEREVGDVADITDAEVIVAGGMGVEGEFGPLERLAELLDAELAGTRDAVEAGWIDPARQVGQTGKTVRPKLYVAVGISGAIQHVEGMDDSETVIAINNDPNAPIFENADYGIVGDCDEVLPQLIEALERQEVAA